MGLIGKHKIEEILRNLWKEDDGHNAEHRICYNKALQEVLYEIDNLEMNEVDLDKALSDLDKDIKEFVTTEEFENESTTAGHYWVIAKHAFLLGLKANNPITAVESTERHLQEPTIVYVVSRGEEHSDYVEEVFLDESKAKKYCGQFKGDENEYVRYITKVKLTL